MHKERAGDRTRTADLSWPKGCSIPCSVMWNNKTGGSWLGGPAAAWGQAEQWVVGAENCVVCYLLCSFHNNNVIIILIVVIIIIFLSFLS